MKLNHYPETDLLHITLSSKAVFARNPSQGVSQWKTKVNQNGKIQFEHPPPPIHSVEKT